MIRRNITYKEKSLIIPLPLYNAIVRPHIEYCIQAWGPYLRKDIDMLEKIQRRATKLIPGLNGISKYHSGIIATSMCIIEDVKGIQWYSMVMNGISKYHSGIIETGKCTIDDVSSTEWYSMVINGISKYHSGIIETGTFTIEAVSGTEWYLMEMNGISKYHSGYH